MATIIEQRAEALKSAKAIFDGAKAAHRESTDAERATVKSFLDTVEECDRKIKATNEGNALQERLGGLGGGSSFGPAGDGEKGRVGAIRIDAKSTRTLFEHAKSASSFRVELDGNRLVKAAPMAGLDPRAVLPASYDGKLIGPVHEAFRALSLIPTKLVDSPSVEVVTIGAVTGGATTVAAGGLKPELAVTAVPTTVPIRKLAVTSAVNDEVVADFDGFAQYLSAEMVANVTDAEDAQILYGDGTGSNLAGITTAPILSRSHADVEPGTTVLDTLAAAINDIRVGSSLTVPDAMVMHPSTWLAIRLTKDQQGRYLLDPAATDVFGVPVHCTTAATLGTALIGAFSTGAQAFVRSGLTVETSSNSGTDFVTNTTRLRVEERLAVAVVRATSFVQVTGL